MNRIENFISNISVGLFLSVFFFIHQTVAAQVIVTPAGNSSINAESSGFYYSLPRNIIKVDFIIEKNKCVKGPYSEYAPKILGIDDVIIKDETKFTLIDVIVSTTIEPDPEATFFVEFDEKASKEEKSLIFNLQEDGIILGANDVDNRGIQKSVSISKTLVNDSEKNVFQYYAESNLYQRVDTIVRKITIDTTTIRRNILQSSWVDRSPEQKARAAADYIQKIRDSRFNLISGYQEVNYGNSILFMDEKLKIMEDEYVDLFVGKEIKTLKEQSVEFLPSKENIGIQLLARFSETGGLSALDSKSEPIQIEISPVGNTTAMKSENKNSGKDKIINNLYYRTPEYVKVKVLYKGSVIAEKKLLISQLGSLSKAPISKTRLMFDANTGMVTTIKRD
jgi:hypothetical protein